MSKPPRPNLQGLIAPPPSHNRAIEQPHDDMIAQLHDADVPTVSPDPEPKAPASIRATRSGRAKAVPVEAELKDYAHRSLYARPETLDLIRRIAFEERTSAQALYREGLFLMLRKRGHYRDKQLDDV